MPSICALVQHIHTNISAVHIVSAGNRTLNLQFVHQYNSNATTYMGLEWSSKVCQYATQNVKKNIGICNANISVARIVSAGYRTLNPYLFTALRVGSYFATSILKHNIFCGTNMQSYKCKFQNQCLLVQCLLSILVQYKNTEQNEQYSSSNRHPINKGC